MTTQPDNEPIITSQEWAQRLLTMGDAVVRAVVRARDAGADLATPVAEEGGDTIFAIDRHVEPVLERVISTWQMQGCPLTLVAEGLGKDGRQERPGHQASGDARGWTVITDPIDGTRNLMYDKRSAWFLAAVMPNPPHGSAPTLRDAVASVAVELPCSKQGLRDRLAGWRSSRESWQIVGNRVPVNPAPCAAEPVNKRLSIAPSTATSLAQGFAQVTNFFPGTKVLASELMERIVAAMLGDVAPGSAAVFDDQYISTGGQFVELMMGRDRFCCDLRPLFYRLLEKQTGQAVRGLECHPYDVVAGPLAEAAGVVLTDGFGQPLDAPLDVFSPVHWCGYANESLRQQIEPLIQSFWQEHGLHPE